jgi:hypothetical protein
VARLYEHGGRKNAWAGFLRARRGLQFTHPNSSTNGNAQMAVEVDTVQPLRGGGYGFNIKTKPYTWLTLHYETKEAAEEGRIHALKATEKRRPHICTGSSSQRKSPAGLVGGREGSSHESSLLVAAIVAIKPPPCISRSTSKVVLPM